MRCTACDHDGFGTALAVSGGASPDVERTGTITGRVTGMVLCSTHMDSVTALPEGERTTVATLARLYGRAIGTAKRLARVPAEHRLEWLLVTETVGWGQRGKSNTWTTEKQEEGRRRLAWWLSELTGEDPMRVALTTEWQRVAEWWHVIGGAERRRMVAMHGAVTAQEGR